MTSQAKRAWLALAALVLSVPVALIATFALAPLWRWIEAATGIESIGHSGPAAWCVGAVEGLLVVAVLTAMARRR